VAVPLSTGLGTRLVACSLAPTEQTEWKEKSQQGKMGMLLLIPGLDKILSHVSSLQTEDMVLLDVITSLGGQ